MYELEPQLRPLLRPSREQGDGTGPGVSSSAQGVLELQRLAGNRAVTGLLQLQRDDDGPTSVLAPPKPANEQTGGGQVAPVQQPGTASPSTAPALDGAKLLAEAGSEWTKVKAMYAKKAEDEPKMRAVIAYRKTYVDAVVERLVREFSLSGVRAVGSTAITSDYDVTFLGPMQQAAPAVQKFNKIVGEQFGKEAGVVFDTNVYAEDFLGGKPESGVREDDPTKMTPEGAIEENRLQDVNALVKMRKNMTRFAWSQLGFRIAESMPMKKNYLVIKQFEEADAVYRSTYVGSLIARLPPDTVAAERKRGLSDEEIVEHHETGSEGVAASNREYESRLLEVARLETMRDNLAAEAQGPPTRERWTALTLEIRKAKSSAMLFANEPYFSAGTLYHVVGNLQSGFGTSLDVPEYFHSANENFGDFKKEVDHKGGEPLVKFAIAASKYAYRFLDAAVELQLAGIPIKQPVATLRGQMAKLLAIRQGEFLDPSGARIDERALKAGRDASGKLRKKDAKGDASGEEIPTGKDYSKASAETKDADAADVLSAMGVGSVSALDALLTKIAIEVNAATRTSGLDLKPG
jgi:hypothetical protein